MNETTWKLYLSSDEAWEGMYSACAGAQKSIDFEQYLFSDDLVGRRFIMLLIQKAYAGVRVRVLCDAVGSRTLYVSPVTDEMQRAGIELLFFNPITPWWVHRVASWFLRDHRKIMIIDGERGFTGGVGIESPMKGWRDTHLEMSGPTVALMEQAFERMWQETKRSERFIRFPRPAAESKDFNFLTNSPYLRQRFVYHLLLAAIKGAQNYIYLETPYFVPNRKLFRALKRARRRGVDVRLVLPLHSDHPLVDLASQSYFTALLKIGVRIYCYKNRMMHAKVVIVDDTWASVGSANLDNLSLLLNYEDAIVSSDPKFISDLKAQFKIDCEASELLSIVPWRERSLLVKILQLLTLPIHRFL